MMVTKGLQVMAKHKGYLIKLISGAPDMGNALIENKQMELIVEHEKYGPEVSWHPWRDEEVFKYVIYNTVRSAKLAIDRSFNTPRKK